MTTIHTRIEEPRGCGYRKPGGLYFTCKGKAAACYKLPAKLDICPCCNQGIKFSRGFTWILSDLISLKGCTPPEPDQLTHCSTCPMNFKNQKMGLMWVGEKFYPTPYDFVRESKSRGVSKRIANVPKEFEVGKTWIALAHRKAYPEKMDLGKVELLPGIFSLFKPDAIEYVTTGNETEEELQALEKRGFTLVKVIKDSEAQLTIV